MEKNFVNKNYFNYEECNKLFQIIRANKSEFAQDDIQYVDEALSQCRNYVNVVDTTEQQIRMASVRFEDDDYREHIMLYDKARRRAHEDAILATSTLNKFAALYGCDKLYSGSEDRLEVADFCLEVVVKIFNNRTK